MTCSTVPAFGYSLLEETAIQRDVASAQTPLSSARRERSFFAGGMWIVTAIAVAKLALHCFFNNRYGYFRDEFDYMACGDHLAWGYVDQPPLVPLLVRICRMALGDSLRSIRFVPALAASALVILTAMIGMEEKYSIAVLGFAIAAGLLLTEQRHFLANRWIWLGGAAAVVLFLPNLIWNVQNHWPFAELMHNIKANGRDVELSPAQYFSQQLLLVHPLVAPVWITGVIALLFSARLKPYRALGWSYLAAFVVFVALKGKNYYLAPIYPVLLAAGAVTIESGIERSRHSWLKPVIVAPLLAAGAWLAPLVVPVLPVDRFITYMEKLPFKVPRSEKSHMAAVLPQHYADQFGWEEMAATVAQAWSRLAPDERSGCGILAQDYGQAGAIDFFGRRYGLPPALSGHQTYFLWGPRAYSGNCLIVLDDRKEDLEQKFERVEYAGMSDNPYALARHVPVFICKGAKFGSLAQLWPKLKKWR